MDDVSPFLALPLAVLAVSLLFLFFFFSSTGGRTSSPTNNGNGRSLPPSPPGLPLIGHLPLLGPLPHRTLRATAATHGPVMLLRLGRVPTVVVSSAAAAQEAMTTRDLAFASRPGGPMVERLLYGRDMAFAPYGDHWRRARRACVLHLLGPRCVLSLRRVREQEAAVLLDRVRGAGGRDDPRGAVNLSDLLVAYSSNLILRAAFGDDTSYGLDGGGTLRKVFGDFEELMGAGTLGELLPWLAWVDSLRGLHAKATRTFQALDGLLERAITDHRNRRRGRRREGDDGHHGFVSVLLDANETEEEAGGVRFDTVTIKAIVLDMFIAGSDTAATIVEWAMAELMNHPDEMRKLQEEIRAAIRGGDGNHDVTEDHVEKLRYLKAVLKETLRLHMPAPLVPRETAEDTELLGHRVPARTRVLFNVWAIGRDPTAWERAEEFLPERFVGDEALAVDQYVRRDFTFLPFGGGRRGCPGAGLGMASVELALASLLYHFDWELPPVAGGASTVDMGEQRGLAVRLKKALRLVAKPWSP